MYPFLFKIGNFPIGTYGVLIALGLLLGIFLAVWRGRQVGVDADVILDLAFYVVLSGIVGSRILFILLNFEAFLSEPLTYLLARDGFVFMGGLLLAVPVVIWYLKKKKQDIWQVLDVIAPSAALGHVFGRIGCFFAGCCYGKVCSPTLLWAVRFPKGSLPYYEQVQHGIINATAQTTLPVHPTELYHSLTNFIVFVLLMLLWRKRTFKGQIFISYIFLYSVMRFIVEFFRGDKMHFLLGYFTTTQISCTVIGIASIYLYLYVKKKQAIPKA